MFQIFIQLYLFYPPRTASVIADSFQEETLILVVAIVLETPGYILGAFLSSRVDCFSILALFGDGYDGNGNLVVSDVLERGSIQRCLPDLDEPGA